MHVNPVTRVGGIRLTLIKLVNQILHLQEDLAKVTNKVLNMEIEDLQAEVEALAQSVAVLQAQTSDLANTLSTAVVDLSALEDQVAGMTDSVTFSEVPTGGMFGVSPIFRKAVGVGFLLNGTKLVPHGIMNLGLVVSFSGWMTDGTELAPLPRTDTQAARIVEVTADVTNLVLVANYAGYTSFSGVVVVEYTKTVV